jgi:hypothetical protein
MAATAPRGVELAHHIATVWRLARARPHLMAAHAAAYAALAQDEAAASTRLIRRRVLWLALCAGGLLVGTMLLGVALMLWASSPPGTLALPGVFWAVPALPLLLAGWAGWVLNRADSLPLWTAVKAQAASDLALLRTHDN